MSKFASFIAGMGTGYIKASDKRYERARQEKEDKWVNEQRDRLRADWTEADGLKAELSAAANPVTMGSLVTDDSGSNAYTKDRSAAAMMADMSRAKSTGTQVQDATRVVNETFTDPAKAAEAAKIATTPDAESQRVQEIYKRRGMRDKAMQEFTANENYKTAIQQRREKLEKEGVSKTLSLLRAGSPEEAMQAFNSSGSIKLPEGSKFVQVDGTDMFTGQPGKVWSAVGPDGKTIVGDIGMAAAQYLGIADQFTQMRERANADYKVGRDKVEDSRWQQTFDFNKQKEESDSKYRERVFNLQAAQNRRQAELHKITMESEKIPFGVKSQAAAISKEMEQIGAALSKSMAEGTYQGEESPGIQKLRERQVALNLKYSQLLAPYTPNAKAAGDVLDIDGPPAATPAPAPSANPAAAPAAAPAPAAPPVQKTMQNTVNNPPQAPAKPQVTLADVLAGPGASPALRQIAQARAQQIEQAAGQLRAAQAAVADAARSGNQQAVGPAMQAAAQAGEALKKLTAGMNDQQAAQVRQSLGL
jgi:hypothetical protein